MRSPIRVTCPPGRRRWVGNKKDTVVSAVTGASSKIGDITPEGEEVTYRAARMTRLAERTRSVSRSGRSSCRRPGLLPPSTSGGRAHGLNG